MYRFIILLVGFSFFHSLQPMESLLWLVTGGMWSKPKLNAEQAARISLELMNKSGSSNNDEASVESIAQATTQELGPSINRQEVTQKIKEHFCAPFYTIQLEHKNNHNFFPERAFTLDPETNMLYCAHDTGVFIYKLNDPNYKDQVKIPHETWCNEEWYKDRRLSSSRWNNIFVDTKTKDVLLVGMRKIYVIGSGQSGLYKLKYQFSLQNNEVFAHSSTGATTAYNPLQQQLFCIAAKHHNAAHKRIYIIEYQDGQYKEKQKIDLEDSCHISSICCGTNQEEENQFIIALQKTTLDRKTETQIRLWYTNGIGIFSQCPGGIPLNDRSDDITLFYNSIRKRFGALFKNYSGIEVYIQQEPFNVADRSTIRANHYPLRKPDAAIYNPLTHNLIACSAYGQIVHFEGYNYAQHHAPFDHPILRTIIRLFSDQIVALSDVCLVKSCQAINLYKPTATVFFSPQDEVLSKINDLNLEETILFYLLKQHKKSSLNEKEQEIYEKIKPLLSLSEQV